MEFFFTNTVHLYLLQALVYAGEVSVFENSDEELEIANAIFMGYFDMNDLGRDTLFLGVDIFRI